MTKLNMSKKTRCLWAAGMAALAVAGKGVLADDDWATAAKAFCEKSPQPCGWVADDSEEWNALNLGVYMEGTAIGGWYVPNEDGDGGQVTYPPRTLETFGGMSQEFPRFISCGCLGKEVTATAVFKLEEGSDISTGAGLDAKQKTRCSLGTGEQPADNDGSDCQDCSDESSCDINVSEWYSDTVTFTPTDSPMVSIFVNPGQTLDVQSFEAAGIASSGSRRRLNESDSDGEYSDGEYSDGEYSDEASPATAHSDDDGSDDGTQFDPCYVHTDCET
eukprot:CAMPEP_0197486662 /NCGR_PEP_ID=MMETSP1311-20131121/1624_1 /TAXON_ID=464262 /ORGANISM="Genus nov. species nov., Strain RCC856" /LENGTH=274 /DNA_ID=CAMNT_0043029875 /DNA_START=44 /DNA_END=864 /DNA_ORIENTATION=+